MSSLIKLRQLDTLELSGWLTQFLAGQPTPSGYSFNEDIYPSNSGVQNLGNLQSYWDTLYTNNIRLPSGSGIFFGGMFFTTSGSNALVITDPSGVQTVIKSNTNYVTYIGPQGPIGPTGATGAQLTGVTTDSSGNAYFWLQGGINAGACKLPSGLQGPTGTTGPSGLSVTGSVSGSDTGGTYFKLLFNNGSTGQAIYVPSGAQGADGEIGGVTLNFSSISGLFSGQSTPVVSIDGLQNQSITGGPSINLIKGFSYKFKFNDINSLVYVDSPNPNVYTNLLIYGANDTGSNCGVDSSFGLLNGAGSPLTGIANSGVLLLTFFKSTTPIGRYTWEEDSVTPITTSDITGTYLISQSEIFENYSYIPETINLLGTGYNFYWKTQGAVNFGDLSAGDNYKYGFALYYPTVSNPPELADLKAFYVLGDLNLSYAPLAGPIGPQGIQGIPGPAGLIGASGAIGPTGVGVSGINTIITDGILNGFQLALSNGAALGPYFIPTGGPVGATGAQGAQGATGVGVVNVVQDSATGIHFYLSNGNSTSPIALPVGPQGPSGLADSYYTYFNPVQLRISGNINGLTGFQTGSDGVNWSNATGGFRTLTTGSYLKIFGNPTLPFSENTFSTSQSLIFAERGHPSNYFGAQVVSFDGTDLVTYINPQIGFWTTNGLDILGLEGNIIDVNLGSIYSIGPTGVSVTGVAQHYDILSQVTGIQFEFSDSSLSTPIPLLAGPRGAAGTTQAFLTQNRVIDTDSTQYVTGMFDSADMYEIDLTGTLPLYFSINSGNVGTGDVRMVMIRNSGYGAGIVYFNPANQFYFVNNIQPAFPSANLSCNIYTFIRGIDYNNHPVYRCTYAANYPALQP